MGLSYQDLLHKLESLLEKKFSDKDTQFNVKFLELANAINDLKRSNSQLIQVNSALIDQNKALRAALRAQSSIPVDDDSDGSDEFRDARDGGVACGDIRDEASYDANNVDGNKEEDVSADKKYHDVLILTDSIYRHVGTVCPKQNTPLNLPFASCFMVGNISVKKVVCPGARCDRLLSLAAELHINHSFGHVIVHVGVNYTRSQMPPLEVADEIKQLLDAVGELFDAKTSFSCALPVSNPRMTDYIDIVNGNVSDFCWVRGYGFIQCMRFMPRDERASLLAMDGIHLSSKGARALFFSVAEHIKYEHKFTALPFF